MILQNLSVDKQDIKVNKLIDKLVENRELILEEYEYVLNNIDKHSSKYLFECSRKVTDKTYGKSVYMRGLIEISNYCMQDCNYCGIRKSNDKVKRYRLTKDEILACCELGYQNGFKTFVLQGGEDPYYSKEILTEIISAIRNKYPDCAITLSIGERTYDEYEAFYHSGANRFLLRHESASKYLYEYLHPTTMEYDNRIQSLNNLKAIGFQTGAGFMVGSPKQTNTDLAKDLLFLQKLQPAMCGIGPYICHKDTPFNNYPNGEVDKTIVMVALARLILPNCLLPATTALGTLTSDGREKALLAGANVVMPNLTPINVRKNYEIYQNKSDSDQEAVQNMEGLKKRVESVGLNVDMSIGDTKMEGYM